MTNIRYNNPLEDFIYNNAMKIKQVTRRWIYAGADPGFQVRGGGGGGGADLKKLRRAEGGANIFEIFRVKNHDFTPKNLIFSTCGGRREIFWGISCGKSRFYAKQFISSNFFGGGGGRRPLDPPLLWMNILLLKFT